MQRIPLGETNARVSAMCLGAMYFGMTVDERTSFDLYHAYLDDCACPLEETLEALDAGVAPLILRGATDESALELVALQNLKQHALDLC